MGAIYWSLLLWVGFLSSPTQQKAKGVAWQAAESLSKIDRSAMDKPIIVDVYTDWCQYCKLMDATTWRHNELSAYVNSHFTAVKFDAESTAPLQWLGKTYDYQARYKVHMLAVELLQGNMVYPSTIIIPPSGDIQVFRGAYKAKELELALKYYGSGDYKTTPFTAFQQQFRGEW